jgi:hypothetical protein
MKATYKITDPDSVEATLTITMTIGAWKKLREQIGKGSESMSYPNFRVRDLIHDLIQGAQKEFETEGVVE